MDSNIKVESWVPESLKQEIKKNNSLMGLDSVGRNLQRYCLRLLYDRRMEKPWLRLTSKGVDPVKFFNFVAFIGMGLSQNYRTKKKSSSELKDWQGDVQRTAKKLAELVSLTPYDMILAYLGLELTKKAGATARPGLGLHSMEGLLWEIGRTDVEDIAAKELFTRVGKRRSSKDWAQREFVVLIEKFLRDETNSPMADVNAAVVNSLMNKKHHLEISSREIYRIVSDYKKTLKRK